MGVGQTDENTLQRLTRENRESRKLRMVRFWRVFGVLRIIWGIAFILIGGGVFIFALSQRNISMICFTTLGPVIGILLLCAKPPRPSTVQEHKPDL